MDRVESAIIPPPRFGNPFRSATHADALRPSAEKRGACGAALDLTLTHKSDPSIRSHDWTFEIPIPDAPRADEILVACAGASGGRSNARIGLGPSDDET
ncbi:MAG: amino acid synthesis family protein [Sciscionella sp.]